MKAKEFEQNKRDLAKIVQELKGDLHSYKVIYVDM